MKRISFVLLAAFAASLSFLSSCSKAERADGEAVCGEAVKIDTDFSAWLPGAAPQSKTSVDFSDGGKVLWTTDDPIMVSNGTQSSTMFIKRGGDTGSSLYTTGAVLSGDAFYAVYPATGASYEAGAYSSNIPLMQAWKDGGFADQVFPMVARAGTDRQLAFKNAASLLRILPTTTFYAGQSILSVVVSADQPLAGAITVDYPEDGVPAVNCTGSKTVTLSAPAGAPFGTSLYVVVAPGDYTGVNVTLTLSNGLKYVHEAGDVSVERSKYQTISFTAVDNYVDLSASGTANCYMITEPGSYKFKATTKGNGVSTSCGLSPATTGISALKSYYTDGEAFLSGAFSLVDDYVYFTTQGGTLPAGTILLSGNDASGTTLWSWHLWANPAIEDVTLSDGTTWLNMNLGAHQVAFNPLGFNGYYYQWGRKDPFQQVLGVSNVLDAPFVSHASQTDGSLTNSIKNPHIFYGSYNTGGANIQDWCTFDDDVKYYDWWNKNITADQQTTAAPGKTMFDPCPPGYHVPTYAEVVELCKLTKAAGTQGATVDGKLFFPYVSSRAAGITKKWWGGVAESDTDQTTGERGFYQCTNPYNTGDKSHRTVYRWYARKGSVGYSGSYIQRAEGMVVRCKKD